jgi:hypothetical protein
MKNAQTWAPSKFVLESGRLRASHNPKEISAGSRLGADLVANCYDTHVRSHCRGGLLDLGCGKVPFYALYRPYVSETVCIDWRNSSHGNDSPAICRNHWIRNHLDQRNWGCTRSSGGHCFKIHLTIRSGWRVDRACTPGRLSKPGHITSRRAHFREDRETISSWLLHDCPTAWPPY